MNFLERIWQGTDVMNTVLTDVEAKKDTNALKLSKLQTQVINLRKEIANQFQALGGEVYVLYGSNRQDLFVENIITHIERIEILKRKLEKKESELADSIQTYEEQSISSKKFLAFKDELEASDGMMEHFEIQEKSVLIGMNLNDIEPPQGLLIMLISRDGELVIPNGDKKLVCGDKIILIGRKNAIVEILSKLDQSQ